jgi:hypothetical protein
MTQKLDFEIPPQVGRGHTSSAGGRAFGMGFMPSPTRQWPTLGVAHLLWSSVALLLWRLLYDRVGFITQYFIARR